jgi:plasmid rolling circle replication initiator protein Rep
VICREDLTLICASCAIFCHKGHDFKSVNEFQTDKLKRCQDILELTDDKRVLEEKICGKTAKENIDKQFHNIKEQLVDEAKRHFNRLINAIHIAQESCIEKILLSIATEYDRIK